MMTKFVFLLASIGLIFSCTKIPDVETDRYQYDDIGDEDRDGVINARDICQQTPLNVGVDNNGCTTWDVKEQIDYVDFNFAFDSDVVPEDAKSDLAQLAQKVISNDDFHITIIGDTSPEGSLAYKFPAHTC